jgi:hypothetical protein
VRAKQRLSYQRRPLPLACVYSVSPHVNAAVMLLLCAVPPKVEDEYVEKLFEKSVKLCEISD